MPSVIQRYEISSVIMGHLVGEALRSFHNNSRAIDLPQLANLALKAADALIFAQRVTASVAETAVIEAEHED